MCEELARLVKEIKSQGYEDICFFQPVYAITGATTCKIQMAKYLAEHTDLKIHLCDFIDGHPRTLIQNSKNINLRKSP